MGTLACILASAFASYIGWLVIRQDLFNPLVLIPVAMGVAGCMIDSVIGATLERRGLVSKLENNMMSMAMGSVLAALAYIVL